MDKFMKVWPLVVFLLVQAGGVIVWGTQLSGMAGDNKREIEDLKRKQEDARERRVQMDRQQAIYETKQQAIIDALREQKKVLEEMNRKLAPR